jgi:putative ABC transport system permease protein
MTISIILILLSGLNVGFVREKYMDTDFMILGISNDNVSNFIIMDNKTDITLTDTASGNGNSYIIGKKDIKLYVNESLINMLKSEEGVDGVVGTYTTSFNPNNNFDSNNNNILTITGFKSSEQELMKINIIKGRMFDDDKKEIVLSKKEMKVLNKDVGDSVSIANEDYEVVGITDKKYGESYTSLKNVLDIETVKQENGGKQNNRDILWEIHIKVKPNYNITKIAENIEKKYESEEKRNLSLHVSEDKSTISFLPDLTYKLIPEFIAIIMILIFITKSVHDKTQEIGLLKAIGWKSKRIFSMILGETFILSICSFLIGSITCLIINFEIQTTKANLNLDFISFLQTLDTNVFTYTFLIVIGIALIGGLFPAIKASRLSPTEALKYE